MMEVDAVLLGSGNGAFHRQTTAQTTCRHQASTDSLVENAGPIDTLPLFNRIAPNALFARIPSGSALHPTTRITVVADWPSRQRATLDFFDKVPGHPSTHKNSTTCKDRHTAILTAPRTATFWPASLPPSPCQELRREWMRAL